jgi:hypothetical protein
MENTVQQQPSIENLKSAISEIKSLVADSCFPNNKKLIGICRQNAIQLIGGNNDSHLVHELLETAMKSFAWRRFPAKRFIKWERPLK